MIILIFNTNEEISQSTVYKDGHMSTFIGLISEMGAK